MIILFCCVDSMNFMTYNMSYLELIPEEFFCVYDDTPEGTEVSCVPDDFCGRPDLLSYRPNFDLENSFHNWVQKLDLTCRPSGQIGLLGSSVFAGWCISLTFIPRLSDLYGRKKIFFLSAIVQTTVYTIIMLTHNFWVAITALFVVGLCCTVRA